MQKHGTLVLHGRVEIDRGCGAGVGIRDRCKRSRGGLAARCAALAKNRRPRKPVIRMRPAGFGRDSPRWQAARTLQGHTARLTSAVFAPDGGRILTACADNTALAVGPRRQVARHPPGQHRHGLRRGVCARRQPHAGEAAVEIARSFACDGATIYRMLARRERLPMRQIRHTCGQGPSRKRATGQMRSAAPKESHHDVDWINGRAGVLRGRNAGARVRWFAGLVLVVLLPRAYRRVTRSDPSR
jgi:hypothetical protein